MLKNHFYFSPWTDFGYQAPFNLLPLTLNPTPLSGFSRKQQTAEFRVKLTSRPKINSKFESITEKAVGNHFSESAWPEIRLKTAILIYSNLVIRYYLRRANLVTFLALPIAP